MNAGCLRSSKLPSWRLSFLNMRGMSRIAMGLGRVPLDVNVVAATSAGAAAAASKRLRRCGCPAPVFSRAVFLHGLGGHNRNLFRLARTLNFVTEENVFPSLRNHGKSGQTNSMTLAEMVADLVPIVEPLKKVALVGHSLGGRVAMLFALLYPRLVDAVIILDVAPGDRSIEKMAQDEAKTAATESFADPTGFNLIQKTFDILCDLPLATMYTTEDVATYITNKFGGKSDTTKFFILNALSNIVRDDESPQSDISTQDSKSSNESLRSHLHFQSNVFCMRDSLRDGSFRWPSTLIPPSQTFNGPAVFVRGAQSKWAATVEDEQAIHQYFTKATIITSPGSHFLHHEHVNETAQSIFNGLELVIQCACPTLEPTA